MVRWSEAIIYGPADNVPVEGQPVKGAAAECEISGPSRPRVREREEVSARLAIGLRLRLNERLDPRTRTRGARRGRGEGASRPRASINLAEQIRRLLYADDPGATVCPAPSLRLYCAPRRRMPQWM
jgi:hypothetical protein